MRRKAFIDTAYLIALMNPRDAFHRRAVELSGADLGVLFTTNAVLTEVADAFSAPQNRRWAVSAIEDLRGDTAVKCLVIDDALFVRAVALYGSRSDKHWSLTDCISFEAMRQHDITDALTADQHFVQAGFNALLHG